MKSQEVMFGSSILMFDCTLKPMAVLSLLGNNKLLIYYVLIVDIAFVIVACEKHGAGKTNNIELIG